MHSELNSNVADCSSNQKRADKTDGIIVKCIFDVFSMADPLGRYLWDFNQNSSTRIENLQIHKFR